MSETSPGFRQTLRGYDPAEVDARIDELTLQLFEARTQADLERRRADESGRAAEDLRAEVRELERRTGLPGYDTVAQRVRRILESADEAALELRAGAEGDAENRKRQAEDRAAELLAEARVEADATLRRGRQVADQAIAESDRRVEGLRGEIAQLEQQRDRVRDALGSLRDRITHVAHELVIATDGGGRDAEVESSSSQEKRRDTEHGEGHGDDRGEPVHHEHARAEGS